MSDETTESKDETETDPFGYPEDSYFSRATVGDQVEIAVMEKLRAEGFHVRRDDALGHRKRADMKPGSIAEFKKSGDLHLYLDPEYTIKLGVIETKNVSSAELKDGRPESYGPYYMCKENTAMIDNVKKFKAKREPPIFYVLHCQRSEDYVTINVATTQNVWIERMTRDGGRPEKPDELVYRCPIELLRTWENMTRCLERIVEARREKLSGN